MPLRANGHNDIPLPFTSSKALPNRVPTRGTSLKRGKTLTRPERHVVPAPLIAPPTDFDNPTAGDPRSGWDWWVIWSYATTFWAPPALLRLFGIKEKQSRQAWREKITLCWIAIILGAIVGFATMGLQRALCPGGEAGNAVYRRLGQDNREWAHILFVALPGNPHHLARLALLTSSDAEHTRLGVQRLHVAHSGRR